jgi:hypothetical protein
MARAFVDPLHTTDDPAHTDGLRPLVEALDREMSHVVARGTVSAEDATALLASWASVVEHLALEPSPELRACPSCGCVGVRGAIVCSGCRRTLEPTLPAASA